MALIIETGTGTDPDANSFVTRAEFIAYAALRGVPVADADASDVYLIKAMDYLFYREPDLSGERTHADQPLPFPRTGLIVNGSTVGSNEIPAGIKKVQNQLALDAFNGTDLTPTTAASSSVLIRQKLGPIEREFSSDTSTGTKVPSLPLAEGMLLPYMGGGAGGGVTRAYRV